MNFVPQQHSKGCAVACVAMVTGRSYAEVQARLPAGWDLYAEGLTEYLMLELLRSFDYAGHVMSPYDVLAKARRPAWPPAPFAPAHIRVMMLPRGTHAVVWLPDGSLLDPNPDEPVNILPAGAYDQYPVDYVLGVYPMVRYNPARYRAEQLLATINRVSADIHRASLRTDPLDPVLDLRLDFRPGYPTAEDQAAFRIQMLEASRVPAERLLTAEEATAEAERRLQAMKNAAVPAQRSGEPTLDGLLIRQALHEALRNSATKEPTIPGML